jgi:hypothetical protein
MLQKIIDKRDLFFFFFFFFFSYDSWNFRSIHEKHKKGNILGGVSGKNRKIYFFIHIFSQHQI